MSDKERPAPSDLAAAIFRGESDAETALVVGYGPGLMYVLRREFGDRETAEDIYQETFRIVLERLRKGDLEEPSRLPAFVLGVARRLVKAHRRTAARHVPATDVLDKMDNGAPSPCEQVILHEQIRAVHAAIQRLTMPRDRELLTRRYLMDQDEHLICEDFGLEAGMFDRTIHRARQRLRSEVSAALPSNDETFGIS